MQAVQISPFSDVNPFVLTRYLENNHISKVKYVAVTFRKLIRHVNCNFI